MLLFIWEFYVFTMENDIFLMHTKKKHIEKHINKSFGKVKILGLTHACITCLQRVFSARVHINMRILCATLDVENEKMFLWFIYNFKQVCMRCAFITYAIYKLRENIYTIPPFDSISIQKDLKDFEEDTMYIFFFLSLVIGAAAASVACSTMCTRT